MILNRKVDVNIDLKIWLKSFTETGKFHVSVQRSFSGTFHETLATAGGAVINHKLVGEIRIENLYNGRVGVPE